MGSNKDGLWKEIIDSKYGGGESEGGRERQQKLSLVEIFEGGLKIGGLGPKFRRSHNLEGGYWEGRFVLGR